MIEVEAPDGSIVEFPDGTPEEKIKSVMRASFRPEQTSNVAAKSGREDVDASTSFAGNLAHSATLGFSDEILGAVDALKMKVQGDDRPFSELFEERRKFFDVKREDAEAINPNAALAGDVAGIVATTALPVGNVARAATLGQKVKAGTKAGAVLGGVHGVGTSEGDLTSVEGLIERGIDGAVGAATGAATGALAVPVIEGGVALGRRAKNLITGGPTTREGARDAAANRLTTALERDFPEGVDPIQRVAQRLDNADDDTILADVAGENVRSLLRASQNTPSRSRDQMQRFVDRRQAKQSTRLQQAIGRTVGDAEEFFQASDDLVAARKAKADPLFEQARATPTPFTQELESVLARPVLQKAARRARDSALNRGEDFSQFFVDVGEDGIRISRVPDTDALHRIKVELDAMIGQLKKGDTTSLKNMNVRDLTIAKKALLGAMDNPTYKRALKEFAGDSAMINALEDGYDVMKLQPEEVRKTIERLTTDGEKELYRMGAARAIFEQLDRGNLGKNRVEMLRTPIMTKMLKELFPNNRSRREFEKALLNEAGKVKTRQAVQGNSTTARQLAEMNEAEDIPAVIEAGQALQNVTSGRLLSATNNVLRLVARGRNRFNGLSPEVANELGDLIMSADGAELQRQLTSRIARSLNAQERRDLIELMIARGSGAAAGGAVVAQ